MCYNISYIEKRADKFAERFSDLLQGEKGNQLRLFEQQPVYYFVSAFAYPTLPVITDEGLRFYQWGLIPKWVKDDKGVADIRMKTLNAVGETVFEKPSFRGSIAKKRCILPVNGFYEWRDVAGRKYPYFIHLKQEGLLSLGCIYENWLDKATGEIKNTFSIITTPANPLLEKIHNLKKRMPLIISREDEKIWIDPKLEKEDIQALIKPYDDDLMDAHTVSTDANSSRKNRNVPEILEEVEYAGLD